MSSVDTGQIIEKMVDRGIDKNIFKTLKYSGVDMEDWLHGFDDVTKSVKMSVDAVRNHPLMDKEVADSRARRPPGYWKARYYRRWL